MSEYRRYYIKGGTWFFTVNLQNRRNQLLTTQFQTLRNVIIKVKRDRPFEINAWVVLPEHMHCIWTLPEGDDDFSSRWREIKKQFTPCLWIEKYLATTFLGTCYPQYQRLSPSC